MVKQTACVTGASSGIGLQLAKVFAEHGHPVVLLARSTEKLEQLAQELRSRSNVRADVIATDLRQPSAPAHIAEELRRRNLTVDILVNNAGFGLRGPYAELDLQQQLDMIQVNITAMAHLTRLLLPGMIQRNAGGVMNVASTAAFQAGPHMAIYYATKAFVLSFTEALHEEVAGTNLRVTCLCPGPTHTGFAATARMEGVKLFKSGAQSAELVARVGYAAIQRNRAIAISGFKNQIGAFATRLTSRAVARKFAMTLNG
jgi:short-subunit dehydrogenase